MTAFFISRLHRFVAARLSPEGETGLHLTVGVVLIAGAAWLFGGIAEDVVNNESLTVLDVTIAHWFHAHASSPMTQAMLLITHVHGMVGSTILGLVLAAWFHVSRQRYWFTTILVALPGGMLLNVLLKYVFQRARPSFDEPLLTLTTYSFPSGHTANAAMLYGLLGCWLWVHHRGSGMRLTIVAGACLMVALVGTSRMYLGVHYLSDVLAATASTCAWLTVCITAMSTWRRRQGRARARESSRGE